MGNDGYNTLEDLLFSSSFRDWVLKGDTPEADFWRDWHSRYPEKGELINQAKAIIYALQLNLRPLADEAVDKEISRVLEKLRHGHFNLGMQQEDGPRPGNGPGMESGPGTGKFDTYTRGSRKFNMGSHRSGRAWAAAAIFASIAIFVWALRSYLHRQQDDGLRTFLAEHKSVPMLQHAENTNTVHILVLPDGSTVRLSPGSRLYYPEKLEDLASGQSGGTVGGPGGVVGQGAATGGQSGGTVGQGSAARGHGHRREVFLEGEAFFDVAHDASSPFYVYTGQLVTKVLGTSFRISSGKGKRTIVAVSTGKVSVYRKTDLADGAILTPNQQITYDPAEDRLDRSITDRPQPLTGVRDTALMFNSTPLSTVFHRLQTLYGIPIIYDEESVSGCSLSVTMGNEPFFDKLNIICKAIGATYESIDGTIVVSTRGGGCK